jgi:nucleoside-diphosphate-sugar epimerase
MNILITGITGFVGSNIKDFLINNNYSVKGASRDSNKSITSVNNLTLLELNEKDVFIHLAGKAHDLKNTSNENEYFEANTALTIKLFNTFLESTCNIFIFMSSVKAVADTVDCVLTEEFEPNPKTAYGKSKHAAENYILSKEIPSTKNVYILRPCMIHGPNNKGNLNLLYSLINKKIPYPLGAYKNKRSFLAVDNLSFIIEKLIQLKPESGIYNVADDDQISTNDLIKIIGEGIGKKAIIINVPKFLIRGIAKLGDLLNLPLNSERLSKLTENYCVSNLKIKEALELELPLNTREGLKRTIKSFKTT